MRICEVSSGLIPIPPDGAGALEKIILSLSIELGKLEHTVYVVDAATKARFDPPRNVVFRRSRSIPLPNKGLAHFLRGIYFMIAATPLVGRLVREEKVDVIHIHNQFSGFLITLCNRLFWRKPLVFTTHNQEIFESGLKYQIKYWPERYILRKADAVVCVSPTVKRLLVSMIGVEERRLVQIFSGIGLTASEAAKRSGPGADPKIITVARIVPRKNQMMVIDAAAHVVKRFPRAKFEFIGPVDDESYLIQLKAAASAQGLSANVVFSGEVPQAALEAAYSTADVFVLTSTNENQGLVILEAMARSVPVICSAIGSFRDMVSMVEGSAIVVDGPSQLAEALIGLIQDPARQAAQILKGRQLVSKLSWDNIAKEHETLFRRLAPEAHRDAGVPVGLTGGSSPSKQA